MKERSFQYERRRRDKDRRQSMRTGKYDRRRNICANCQYYKPQAEIAGLCSKHQTLIKAQDYSCVLFVTKISME